MQRPATVERVSTLRGRAISLAETSPYRRTTASTLDEPAPSEFGPYLVYEKLGEGGMAYVHRAEHVAASGLRKQVALKRLHTDASEDPALVSAFVHEAQLASKLHHPNIAQAYELGKIDNTYFIAMELVPGPTLAEVMIQVRNGAGAVPLPIALEILIQISDALDQVHNLRDETGHPLELIHRDVSPANIIISRTGAAKLIDFGIAKVRSARHSTEAGMIKGKHGYVAPEYTYGHLDHRADLFALGVVAHELLTGRRLFLGATEPATIANVRHLPIPPPSRHAPGLSPQLDAIVLRALEREPGLRWQTAGAIHAALVEEARRLGMAISGPQVRDWVEWAFQQNARRDSSIDRLTNGLDPSVSIVIEIEEPRFPTPVPRAPTPVPQAATPSPRAPTPVPRAPTPVPRAATPVPLEPAPVQKPLRRARPEWRVPTRWQRAPRSSKAPLFVLLALISFAVIAIDQGWIDLDRWREILGV